MDTLNRLRRTEKRIVKAQRRLWLLQMAVWPTVGLACVGSVAAAVIRYRNRGAGGAAPVDGLPHL